MLISYFLYYNTDLLLNGNFQSLTNAEMLRMRQNGFFYGSPLNWTASADGAWGCDVMCANCFSDGNGEFNQFYVMLEGDGYYFSQYIWLNPGKYLLTFQYKVRSNGQSGLGIYLNNTALVGPTNVNSSAWTNQSTTFEVLVGSKYGFTLEKSRGPQGYGSGSICLDNFQLEPIIETPASNIFMLKCY